MAFWQTKTLRDMTHDEWEALCDGCGRCCLHKLEDEDTDELYFTRVACRLLDLKTCRCKQYSQRTTLVSGCLSLQQENFTAYHWLPVTCAYRLLAEGKPLMDWHPLISGTKDSVAAAGLSVADFAISELKLPARADLEDYIIE
jgi:uncharacterized protein